MIIGGVESGKLELDREIVFIKEEIVVWLLPDYVYHDDYDQLQADGHEKCYACYFEVGKLEYFDQGYTAADAEDIIEEDVAVTQIPPQTDEYPYYQADALQYPKIKSKQVE